MADQEAKDVAAQQRIVSHMQKDHHDSVVRYLEHYCHLSSWTAHNSSMTGITLDGMTFNASGKTYRVPFDPPLESYREARERVVAMDKECLAGLGRSDITINEFIWPTGIYALEFAIITATFIGFSQRLWFGRGQVVEQVLGAGFAKFAWTIQPWLISAMVVIHGAELINFHFTRLRKHSISMRSPIWWQWAVAEFVCGFLCTRRFDALVRWKKEAKEKQQH